MDGRGSADDVGLVADDDARRGDRRPRPAGVRLPDDRRRVRRSGSSRRASTSPTRSDRVTASSRAAATGSPRAGDSEMVLTANPHYWAGPPALGTITVLTDLGGASPVERFESGDLDYAPIGRAPMRPGSPTTRRSVRSSAKRACDVDRLLRVRHDRRRRSTTSWSVGRSGRPSTGGGSRASPRTTRRPSRTRWSRPASPAGASATRSPMYDPDAARDLLAEAGYPDGAGFPAVTLVTGGGAYDEAVVTELERELRIAGQFGDDGLRLVLRPARHRRAGDVVPVVGRRLSRPQRLPRRAAGQRCVNNYGGWSSPEFDAAIADAAAATDEATVAAAYDRAEDVVQRDVPVIPMSYGTGWALSREGSSVPARTGSGRCASPGWRGRAGERTAPRQRQRPLACPGPRRHVASWPYRSAPPTPDFGTPTIDGSFGEEIVATQPVTLDAAPDRVEVLVTTADATSPLVTEVSSPGTGATTLRHAFGGADGHILPNTPVRVRWRITTDGVATLGPEVRTVVADDRFDWQTVSGDVVRVHWYEGGRAFGERALRIGEDAVEETARLFGVTEDEPVDFFIYAEPGRVLRRARAGDARERRWPGERRDPDAVRAHRPVLDRRPVGRERRPARARPPRLRHGRREPVPLPAALAERGPGGLPERRLRAGRSGARSRRRPMRRRAHPARRPGRPVPDIGHRASAWPTPRAPARSST